MAQAFAHTSFVCWQMQYVSCRLSTNLIMDYVLILRNILIKWPEVFFSVTGRFEVMLMCGGSAENNSVCILFRCPA